MSLPPRNKKKTKNSVSHLQIFLRQLGVALKYPCNTKITNFIEMDDCFLRQFFHVLARNSPQMWYFVLYFPANRENPLPTVVADY